MKREQLVETVRIRARDIFESAVDRLEPVSKEATVERYAEAYRKRLQKTIADFTCRAHELSLNLEDFPEDPVLARTGLPFPERLSAHENKGTNLLLEYTAGFPVFGIWPSPVGYSHLAISYQTSGLTINAYRRGCRDLDLKQGDSNVLPISLDTMFTGMGSERYAASHGLPFKWKPSFFLDFPHMIDRMDKMLSLPYKQWNEEIAREQRKKHRQQERVERTMKEI